MDSTEEHFGVEFVSKDGYRIIKKGLLSHIASDLLKIGRDDEESMQKLVNLPFSTDTVKYLLSDEDKKEELTSGRGWLVLDGVLKELDQYCFAAYPAVRKAVHDIMRKIHDKTSPEDSLLFWRKCCQMKHWRIFEARNMVLYHLVPTVVNGTIDNYFYRITKEELFSFLSDETLNVVDEKDVVTVIDRWIEIAAETREADRRYLMEAVRRYPGEPPGFENRKDLPARRRRDVLLAIGGWLRGIASNVIEVYDRDANVWRQCNVHLPYSLAYHGSVFLDGELYIMGGTDGRKFYGELHKLTKGGQWIELETMHDARAYITNMCTVHDGKIYVFGGVEGRIPMNRREVIANRLISCECYDPKTNKWSRIASMQFPRSDGAVTAFGDKIMLTGGFNGNSMTADVELYDPKTDSFTIAEPLPVAISGHAILNSNGIVYVFGGFDNTTRYNTIYKRTPRGVWEKTGEMLGNRSTFSVACYYDEVFACGGYNTEVVGSCEKIGMDNFKSEAIADLIHKKSATKLVVAENWRHMLENPEEQMITRQSRV